MNTDKYKWLIVVVALAIADMAVAAEPREVLDRYFATLTSRDFAGVSELMATDSMRNLKVMMDGAIRAQVKNGNYTLQERVFGKRVTLQEVTDATAAFYLESLARQILAAANTQSFFVDDLQVIGEVRESDTMVHFIARLTMSQRGKSTREIFAYTLVREGDDWKLEFPPTIRQLLTVIESGQRF